MTSPASSSRPWTGVVSEDEERVYAAAGFGRPSGLGRRPALLVIDVQYRTVGTTPQPFWESIKEFPTSCGEVGWKAVRALAPVLQEFRRKGWPVLYPYVSPKEAYDAGRLAEKVPSIMGIQPKGYEFVPEVAPRGGDILIPKKHPSAFFGTALASHLVDLGVDTLVVTGCTTSGCVRGTVVDAFSYSYKVVVPEECVYDRGATSHAVNLFDIGQKYADVVPTADLLSQLGRLAAAAKAGA
jgi:maleamate amidohydrolase